MNNRLIDSKVTLEMLSKLAPPATQLLLLGVTFYGFMM